MIILLLVLLFGTTGIIIYLGLYLFASEAKKDIKDAVDFIASPEAHRPVTWLDIVIAILVVGFMLYFCVKKYFL